MNLLNDRETGGTESVGNALRKMRPKGQRDRSAEQFVPMHDVFASMKGDEHQSTIHQGPPRFPQDRREFGQVEVDDGIEQDYSGETCVARAEMPHVLDAKLDSGILVPGHRDHLCGKVDPKDGNALLTRVRGNMSGPTAKIGDGTAAASPFCKPIQEMPVEWLVCEFV